MLWTVMILTLAVMLIPVLIGYFKCTWSDMRIFIYSIIGCGVALVTIYLIPAPVAIQNAYIRNALVIVLYYVLKQCFLAYIMFILFVLPEAIDEIVRTVKQPVRVNPNLHTEESLM